MWDDNFTLGHTHKHTNVKIKNIHTKKNIQTKLNMDSRTDLQINEPIKQICTVHIKSNQ